MNSGAEQLSNSVNDILHIDILLRSPYRIIAGVQSSPRLGYVDDQNIIDRSNPRTLERMKSPSRVAGRAKYLRSFHYRHIGARDEDVFQRFSECSPRATPI